MSAKAPKTRGKTVKSEEDDPNTEQPLEDRSESENGCTKDIGVEQGQGKGKRKFSLGEMRVTRKRAKEIEREEMLLQEQKEIDQISEGDETAITLSERNTEDVVHADANSVADGEIKNEQQHGISDLELISKTDSEIRDNSQEKKSTEERKKDKGKEKEEEIREEDIAVSNTDSYCYYFTIRCQLN